MDDSSQAPSTSNRIATSSAFRCDESPIEILRPVPRGGYRAVLFDFDGTLSLVRANWQDVMLPMMVEAVAATGTSETAEELHAHCDEFVMRLNGKPTIHQMEHLAGEIRARGGTPLPPEQYAATFSELLHRQIDLRLGKLASGAVVADDLAVPGSRRILETLRSVGLPLWLASGTELVHVKHEIGKLELAEFFHPHIYGPHVDSPGFSKAAVIARMIQELNLVDGELLGFGDGVVEIQELKKAGATAVGVASNEETRVGVDPAKRDRLVVAGADIIIGDFTCHDELLSLLGIPA